jgi:4-diphosphocytidyl-2-C-methyl-D-erythritol kinase
LTYTVRAYAKVNLHLEVLNKRSDSYHNIFSLNASLDLFDQLTFKELNIFNNKSGKVSVEIHPEGGEFANVIASIPAEDNLISKAVKSYLNRIGKSGKITVSVKKNIPAGAGLGGGSSDAAAVLNLLNDHFNKSNEGLSRTELSVMGAKLGADVPYCLAGGIAFCEGIGEIIENIPGKLDYWVLNANSGISINTAMAYRALNRSTKELISKAEIEEKKSLFRLGVQKGSLEIFKHVLKNDFENYAFSEHPELNNIKNIILNYDPDYAAMTGSGSNIIGLFKTKTGAEKAKEGLTNRAAASVTRLI